MNDFSRTQKTESIYKRYWKGVPAGNASFSVDSYAEGVRVASQSGYKQKQEANQRLVEQAQEYQSTSSKFVFDR